jgi:aminoglycoside 6'-N-acetyltransferase
MTDTMILRGERVLLRPGRADDVERLAEIRREPEVARWWGDLRLRGHHTRVRRHQRRLRHRSRRRGRGRDSIRRRERAYVSPCGDRHLRHVIPPRQGLGSEAIRLLARYLFDERGHHRLTIDPAASNDAAIRAYERVGFRKVGVMRQYERGPDGTWRDGLLMDMLREDFGDKG